MENNQLDSNVTSHNIKTMADEARSSCCGDSKKVCSALSEQVSNDSCGEDCCKDGINGEESTSVSPDEETVDCGKICCGEEASNDDIVGPEASDSAEDCCKGDTCSENISEKRNSSDSCNDCCNERSCADDCFEGEMKEVNLIEMKADSCAKESCCNSKISEEEFRSNAGKSVDDEDNTTMGVCPGGNGEVSNKEDKYCSKEAQQISERDHCSSESQKASCCNKKEVESEGILESKHENGMKKIAAGDEKSCCKAEKVKCCADEEPWLKGGSCCASGKSVFKGDSETNLGDDKGPFGRTGGSCCDGKGKQESCCVGLKATSSKVCGSSNGVENRLNSEGEKPCGKKEKAQGSCCANSKAKNSCSKDKGEDFCGGTMKFEDGQGSMSFKRDSPKRDADRGVDCSPKQMKKLLSEVGSAISYGTMSCCELINGSSKTCKIHGNKQYTAIPSHSEVDSTPLLDTTVTISPFVSMTTTKLRVQNICCGKEAELMKRELEPVKGIEAVSVNVVGRIGLVRHDTETISAVEIVSILNKLHLGVSIMESGSHDAEHKLRKDFIIKLVTKSSILIVLLILFVVVIIGKVHNSSWQKWVAIAEIAIGCLPIMRKVVLNWLKKIFVDINMLMLIAVAGTVALHEWVEGATLVFVFAVAEVLQEYCGYRVQKAISGLMVHIPEQAVIAETGKSVPVEDIVIGSRIIVCAGEKIALDGDVVKGQASVDESSITGESMPIEKGPGDKTYSGTIVQNGYLEIVTSSDAANSTVSKVTQMVQEAQAKASKAEKLMNKFAKIYTPLVLTVALLIFAIPAVLAEFKVGNYPAELPWWGKRALFVLLIACPCALVMSVPMPMVCGITAAAKNGALVKGGTHMETLAGIKTVAFDKTGTLTEGRFKVVNLREFRCDLKYDEMLKMIAALEVKSSHPVAAAIVNHYSGCITDKIASLGSGVGLPDVKSFKTMPGLGLTGRVESHAVAVGNMKMLQESGTSVTSEAERIFSNWSSSGQTVIFASIDGQLAMMLGLADTPRATARQAIQFLKDMKISTIMLTGDSSGAAAAVMKSVGAEDYIASMKPQHKLNWIRERQRGSSRKRTKVAMIGDGVNDGPSLAAADVGVAIGACATALAIESAGVALMSDSLVKIPELMKLSKFTRRVVYQNIVLALAIKIAVLIAILTDSLTLWMAILSDVGALLIVILNGLRPLLWKKGRVKEVTLAIEAIDYEFKIDKAVDEDDGEGLALIEIKS